MAGASALNTTMNASPPWIASFRKTLSFIIFHKKNWNPVINLSHYNSKVQPDMSGCTDTTRITVPDMGQICTWPKISLHERPKTHTVHALYSIIKQTVHIFQIFLTLWNVYSHESYNNYPHIIDSVFPWPRTRWTFYPVVTGILLYFILFTRIHKMSPFDYFYD